MIDGFCSWKNFLVFQNDRPRWDIFIHFPASHGAMLDDQQGIFWWGLSQIALQQWVFSSPILCICFFASWKALWSSLCGVFSATICHHILFLSQCRHVPWYCFNDQTNYVRVSHIHIIVHSRAPERLDELMDKRRKMDEAILYRNLRRDVEKNNGFSRKMPINGGNKPHLSFFRLQRN